MKKDLIEKMNTMFNQKITKKLNIYELKELANLDDLKEYKDLKSIIGDISSI